MLGPKTKKWKPDEITAFHDQYVAAFKPDYIIGYGMRSLMLRDADRMVLLSRPGFGPLLTGYDDIISARLVPEYKSKTEVKGGGPNVTGALVGGLAFGPAGAIVGAMGKKQKVSEHTWLSRLELQVSARFAGTVSTLPFVYYAAFFSSLSKPRDEHDAVRAANEAFGYIQYAQQLAARAI